MKEYTEKGYSYEEASHLVAIWEDAIWEYRKSEIASGRYREDRNYEDFIGNMAVSTYLLNNSIKKSR